MAIEGSGHGSPVPHHLPGIPRHKWAISKRLDLFRFPPLTQSDFQHGGAATVQVTCARRDCDMTHRHWRLITQERGTSHFRRLECCLDCRLALGFQRGEGNGIDKRTRRRERNGRGHSRGEGFARERCREESPSFYRPEHHLRKAGNIPAHFNLLYISRFGYQGVHHHRPLRGAVIYSRNVSNRKSLYRLERSFSSY